MELETKNKIIKVVAIIIAVVLVLFVCWQAGWILNGDTNAVSDQEKQEAIQQSTDELNSASQEFNNELNSASQEFKDEISNALND